MAVKGGPNIVTQGLNLVLDSGNKKSIPLDPTVNIFRSNNSFTSSLWGKSGAALVTTSSQVGPDGINSASLYSAIGGYCGLFQDNTVYQGLYTATYYVKYINQPTVTIVHEGNPYYVGTYNLQNVTAAVGGTPGLTSNVFIEPASNGFYRIGMTLNVTESSKTLRPILWMGGYNGSDYSGSQVYVANAQLERSNYATSFTGISRTDWNNMAQINATASLSSGSVTSSMPQFQSLNSGLLNFDGTGSFAAITSSWSYLSSSAIETVFRVDKFGTSEVTSIGGYDQNNPTNFSRPVVGMLYLDNVSRTVNASVITLTQVYRVVTSTTILNTGSYYHVVFNKDTTAGTLQLYVNGRLESTNTFDTGSYAQWVSLGNFQGSNIIQISNTISTNINAWSASRYLAGNIPIFKLYSRTLTADEVRQNYNALKTRFGL